MGYYFVVVTNKTVYYTDLAYAPNPMTIYIPLAITNNTNQDLYFKVYLKSVNGSDPSTLGYSNYSRDIGLISAQTRKIDCYLSYDFDPTTITVPSYIHSLVITVEAYTDSTYTTLLDSKDITVNMNYVNHLGDSSSVSILQNWNFDDGTTKGFTSSHTLYVDSATYFSAPYSLQVKRLYYNNITNVELYSPTISITTGGTTFISLKFKMSSNLPIKPEIIYYSIDGGTTWNILDYFDLNGVLSTLYDYWVGYCGYLPLTPNTTYSNFKIMIKSQAVYSSSTSSYCWFDEIVIFSIT